MDSLQGRYCIPCNCVVLKIESKRSSPPVLPCTDENFCNCNVWSVTDFHSVVRDLFQERTALWIEWCRNSVQATDPDIVPVQPMSYGCKRLLTQLSPSPFLKPMRPLPIKKVALLFDLRCADTESWLF